MRISSGPPSRRRTIHFKSSDYEKTATDEFYVLDAQPRSKNKFLFRGRIWVDANDFAITRVEGEPAVNPSWWTVKTDFKRRYQKIDHFWLPESNESETKVRVFGTAVLSIEYRDYEITQAARRNSSLSPQRSTSSYSSRRVLKNIDVRCICGSVLLITTAVPLA